MPLPLNLHRSLIAALGAAIVLFIASCRSTPAPQPAAESRPVSPDTWAVVDGREITAQDVDKAFRRLNDAAEPASNDEVATVKLNLLNDLIVQDILLAKAAALKIAVTDKEIDTAFAEAKRNIADDVFQQELTKRGLTVTDMREGLRRELLTQKLITQELGSKLTVGEKEITDFFNANRAQFNLAEEAYHLAQIVVTPVRDPQLANGTGDDATTPEAATAKVQMLMERLKSGTSFQELAAGYSEDPQSAARGGDIGFVPVSRIRQAPQPMRDAVLNKKPGTVSVASAGGGHTIILVVAHEQAGQRDLSTPGVRDRITEMLRGRREQLFRTAYITAVRSEANVVNHFARRLVESKGEVPNLLPTPGK